MNYFYITNIMFMNKEERISHIPDKQNREKKSCYSLFICWCYSHIYKKTSAKVLIFSVSTQTNLKPDDFQRSFSTAIDTTFQPILIPANPMNAIAKIPAVINAIGVPCNGFGTFANASCSLIPANTTRASVKPKAVETA